MVIPPSPGVPDLSSMIGEEERGRLWSFSDIKGANKRKHILSATHMKLGLAEDRGRKLASAATPNHPDGSKDSSLRSAGNIRIKNEDGGRALLFFKKEGTFIWHS